MLHTVRRIDPAKGPAGTTHLAVVGPVTLCGVRVNLLRAHRGTPARCPDDGELVDPDGGDLCDRCARAAESVDPTEHTIPTFGRRPVVVEAAGDPQS